MEIKGTVLRVEQGQKNNYDFNNLIIKTLDAEYPQTISIEFGAKGGDKIKALNPGDEVEVSINLRGREWTSPAGVTSVFNSIGGWKVQVISTAPVSEDLAF